MKIAPVVIAAATIVLGVAGLANGSTAAQRHQARSAYNTTPAQDAQVLKDTLAWVAHPQKTSKKLRIAWVKEDATLESYTQKETKGGLDVAKAFGASVKVYDAKFDPNQQFRDLQNAITAYKAGQFDAIVVTPVAGSVVCNEVKKAIADHIPIEVENISVCGDGGYTPGAIGYVGMQMQKAENEDYKEAFYVLHESVQRARHHRADRIRSDAARQYRDQAGAGQVPERAHHRDPAGLLHPDGVVPDRPAGADVTSGHQHDLDELGRLGRRCHPRRQAGGEGSRQGRQDLQRRR